MPAGRAITNVVFILLPCVGLATTCLGDEALLKTGVKKAGKLVWTEQAHLEFRPQASKTPIAWDLIQWVNRDSSAPPPFRAPRVMVVHLFDHQKITGEIRIMDKD